MMHLPLLHLSTGTDGSTVLVEENDAAQDDAAQDAAAQDAAAQDDDHEDLNRDNLNSVVPFDCTSSVLQRLFQIEHFERLWKTGWLFTSSSENDDDDGYFFGARPGNGLLYRKLLRQIKFAASRSETATKGSHNSFTSLGGVEGEFQTRRRFGVRRALKEDRNSSAVEAFMTLDAACVGIGPVVHVAGILNNRSVFVVDQHTPLNQLMETHSLNGIAMPPRPAITGLDRAIGLAFERVAVHGLLMLDTKPHNLVVDLSDSKTPKVLAIDYDSKFCAYVDGTDSPCLLVLNTVLFLLSFPSFCFDEFDGQERPSRISYRPVNDLKRRLRSNLALSSSSTAVQSGSGLCDLIKNHLFSSRVHTQGVSLHLLNQDLISRTVIFIANFYAKFDGGDKNMLKCPIADLKFDDPIWPQLVNHALKMKPTAVNDDDDFNDAREMPAVELTPTL